MRKLHQKRDLIMFEVKRDFSTYTQVQLPSSKSASHRQKGFNHNEKRFVSKRSIIRKLVRSRHFYLRLFYFIEKFLFLASIPFINSRLSSIHEFPSSYFLSLYLKSRKIFFFIQNFFLFFNSQVKVTRWLGSRMVLITDSRSGERKWRSFICLRWWKNEIKIVGQNFKSTLIWGTYETQKEFCCQRFCVRQKIAKNLLRLFRVLFFLAWRQLYGSGLSSLNSLFPLTLVIHIH